MQKFWKLSGLFFFFSLFLFTFSKHALAAGTLVSTSGTTVAVGSSASVNALTFTDDAVTPTITALGDLVFVIPSSVNANWNTAITTPTITGNASAKVNATVSYPNAKTLRIDVGSDFAAGETLVVSGLQITGVISISSATPLLFKINTLDPGTSADATTNITVVAGTLTSASLVLDSTNAGAYTTATLSFTTHVDTPVDAKILITFPAGFDVSNLASGSVYSCNILGDGLVSVSGQVVTFVSSGSVDAPAGANTCLLQDIINPLPGSTGTFQIDVQTSAGASGEIETATISGTTITQNTISGTATPASLVASASTNVTFSVTTVGTIPNDGVLLFTFPSGYNVSSAQVACSGFSGSIATTVEDRVVVATRSGGAYRTGGATVCTVSGVTNPSTHGTTGTYLFRTADAGRTGYYDQGTLAGSAIVVSGPIGNTVDHTAPAAVTNVVTTLGKDGTSVVFNWKNPVDVDFDTVKIYRSKTSHLLGDLVAKTSGQTFTDTGLVTSSTYYYLLRPVDKVGNENLDAAEFVVIPGAYSSQMPAEQSPTGVSTSTPPAAPQQPVAGPAKPQVEQLAPHSLVRGSGTSVYYISSAGKRYFFPNEMVFKTWYDSYADVQTVSDAQLAQYPLAGTIRVRAGTALIKIMSDPKVYGVEPDGTLRWIQSETVATILYGKNWNTLVRDVDVGLFQGYSIGDAISVGVYPSGSLVRDGAGTLVKVTKTAQGWRRRKFVGNAFAANRYRATDLRDVLVPLPPSGDDIIGLESDLAYPMP